MNWSFVLFSPNGRLSQKHYWYGVLIILLGNFLSGFLPIIGGLLWLALIWVGIAVYGKRLHDAGKSAWLHAIPWGLGFLLTILGFLIFGGTMLDFILNGNTDDPSAGEIASIIAASGGLLFMLIVSQLVWLIYTLWLGFARPDEGDNAYGSPPNRTDFEPAPAQSVGDAPEENA